MIIEVKVPSPGESVTEVEIGAWLVEDGSFVEKDQEIAEVESDKATLTIIAEEAGKITVKAQEGDIISVGSVVCTIDTSDVAVQGETPVVVASTENHETTENTKPVEIENNSVEQDVVEKPAKAAKKTESPEGNLKITPLARELMKEKGLSAEDLLSGLKRMTKKEVESFLEQHESEKKQAAKSFSREVNRQTMSPLRRKISERLVAVKNDTAMLTTFNEIDMSKVISLRKKYQTQFVDKYGLKLGFMSFFTKAVALAMDFHPMVNSQIDGDDIITPQYVDVGIAVSTPKGLIVPVIRNAESKSISQIEVEIKELADKARSKKISVDELTGGTFTITNGGIFGSLLSTPIINPPQSAILGMHNIVERPVAEEGKVVIRPMMYVALSYDHRIIDGKDSVSFLVKVKEMIENPEILYSGGKDPEKLLLGL
jgi:2-oxoglutarate dehydrogenase E2 component (dihydrolipoamide succinyltransferase)